MGSSQVPSAGLPVSKSVVVNFIQSLIAVVAGNIVYLLLMSHLPLAARHVPMRFDLGVVVDFWFCLVVLGIIKTVTRRRSRSREQQR
jgi:energy-converting hydrogenase Eha subunit A